jgi:predicted transcriptional regulator
MLMKGEFKVTKWHTGAIANLRRNYTDTAAGISKSLGCSKPFCQTILHQLLRMNAVQRRRKNVRRKNPTSIIRAFEYSLINEDLLKLRSEAENVEI